MEAGRYLWQPSVIDVEYSIDQLTHVSYSTKQAGGSHRMLPSQQKNRIRAITTAFSHEVYGPITPV